MTQHSRLDAGVNLRAWLVEMRWAEVLDYWTHARRHYFNLVLGTVLALIGFTSSITGLIVPAWVFWILALGFLIVAQYRTYLDLKRELGAGVEAAKAEADALLRIAVEVDARQKRLRADRVLNGETCHVWELLKPDQRPILENREFVDCTILGPALVGLAGTMVFQNTALGNAPIESLLYEAPVGTFERQGLIMFLNCTFTRCKLLGIAYYGGKEMLDQIRTQLVI